MIPAYNPTVVGLREGIRSSVQALTVTRPCRAEHGWCHRNVKTVCGRTWHARSLFRWVWKRCVHRSLLPCSGWGQARLPTAAGLLESQRRSVRKGKEEKMTVGEGRANLVCHLESIKHHWAHWEGLSLSDYPSKKTLSDHGPQLLVQSTSKHMKGGSFGLLPARSLPLTLTTSSILLRQ